MVLSLYFKEIICRREDIHAQTVTSKMYLGTSLIKTPVKTIELFSNCLEKDLEKYDVKKQYGSLNCKKCEDLTIKSVWTVMRTMRSRGGFYLLEKAHGKMTEWCTITYEVTKRLFRISSDITHQINSEKARRSVETIHGSGWEWYIIL